MNAYRMHKNRTPLKAPPESGSRIREIIRTAYLIIGQRGFVNVSLSDIAAKAGISKALLHYHFKNKDELIGEVYKYAMSEFLAIAVGVFGERLPVEKKISRLFDEFNAFISENPYWYKVIMELTLLGTKRPERKKAMLLQHLNIKNLTWQTLREAVEEEGLAPDIDLEVLASIMIAMANGFALSHLIAREATDFSRFMTYFKRMIMSLIRGKDK